MKAAVFLADGFEEIEAITPLDLLRRAEIDVISFSVQEKHDVTGRHNIIIRADALITEFRKNNDTLYDCLILPGGIPGADNLKKCSKLLSEIKIHFQAGKLIAAICAAPLILSDLDLLSEFRAVCYPADMDKLKAHIVSGNEKTVIDRNLITSAGAGTAVDFSLAIISSLLGRQVSDKLSRKIIYA